MKRQAIFTGKTFSMRCYRGLKTFFSHDTAHIYMYTTTSL